MGSPNIALRYYGVDPSCFRGVAQPPLRLRSEPACARTNWCSPDRPGSGDAVARASTRTRCIARPADTQPRPRLYHGARTLRAFGYTIGRVCPSSFSSLLTMTIPLSSNGCFSLDRAEMSGPA